AWAEAVAELDQSAKFGAWCAFAGLDLEGKYGAVVVLDHQVDLHTIAGPPVAQGDRLVELGKREYGVVGEAGALADSGMVGLGVGYQVEATFPVVALTNKNARVINLILAPCTAPRWRCARASSDPAAEFC